VHDNDLFKTKVNLITTTNTLISNEKPQKNLNKKIEPNIFVSKPFGERNLFYVINFFNIY
jgi:hypothetical protein